MSYITDALSSLHIFRVILSLFLPNTSTRKESVPNFKTANNNITHSVFSIQRLGFQLFQSRPTWKKTPLGSSQGNCCWTSPAQSFLVPSSAGLITTFYCVMGLGVESCSNNTQTVHDPFTRARVESPSGHRLFWHFWCFPQSFQANIRVISLLGHRSFLPNPF
jgi:hypothetical protein